MCIRDSLPTSGAARGRRGAHRAPASERGERDGYLACRVGEAGFADERRVVAGRGSVSSPAAREASGPPAPGAPPQAKPAAGSQGVR
eukprot:8383997-Alexandrium_andersonii.AAC.1